MPSAAFRISLDGIRAGVFVSGTVLVENQVAHRVDKKDHFCVVSSRSGQTSSIHLAAGGGEIQSPLR